MPPTSPQIQVFNLSRERELWSWSAGETNLAWMLVSPDSEALAVDVPDAGALLGVLAVRRIRLANLLFTHSHADHVDRVADVVRETGCRVWGHPDMKLPVPVSPLSPGAGQRIGGLRVDVMDTSGHSPLDLSYLFPEPGICFCGDTLFDGGCGRMFAGPADRFWRSLLALRGLPDATWLAMGHDYARENFTFARSVCSGDSGVEAGWREVNRTAAGFRYPVTVAQQKRENLFLRADEPGVAEALDCPGATASETFAELRERKNRF